MFLLLEGNCCQPRKSDEWAVHVIHTPNLRTYCEAVSIYTLATTTTQVLCNASLSSCSCTATGPWLCSSGGSQSSFALLMLICQGSLCSPCEDKCRLCKLCVCHFGCSQIQRVAPRCCTSSPLKSKRKKKRTRCGFSSSGPGREVMSW